MDRSASPRRCWATPSAPPAQLILPHDRGSGGRVRARGIERADVGAGQDDLVDLVEDLVREREVGTGEMSSSCSIVCGPMIALVTPGWAIANANARCVIRKPAPEPPPGRLIMGSLPAVPIPTRTWKEIERLTCSNVGSGPVAKRGVRPSRRRCPGGRVPSPPEGIVLAHFIVSDDVERSRRFYTEVLGGRVTFPGDPVNVALANSWIVINGGGGPTDDKPTVILETPRDPDRVSSFLNIRVKDIEAVYAEWSARGAEFLTPPKQHQFEKRLHPRSRRSSDRSGANHGPRG